MRVMSVDAADAFWDDGTALRAGLCESVPRIPPVFGYDERGSELLERCGGVRALAEGDCSASV